MEDFDDDYPVYPESAETDITKPKGLMRWNPHGEFWEFTTPYECVNTAESTEKLRHSYSTRDYVAIFPEYKPGDVVSTSSDLTIDLFLHLKLGKQNELLPNGVYVVDVGASGMVLRPYAGSIDNYVALPHSVEKLPEDMKLFFEKKHVYEELGLRHKRGALVYGPPGNGKTFRIMKCASEFVNSFDGLVFTLANSIRTLDFLQYLTPVIHNRNSIVIMEEITERVQHDIQSTLRFLDGDTSWNNTYIIATTNYPEKLPLNFIDRPGRFDILLEVNDPDPDSRKKYMEHFVGQISDELVKDTEGYSIAYLREMVIRSKLDAVTLPFVLKTMRDRKTKISNKFAKGGSLGRYG